MPTTATTHSRTAAAPARLDARQLQAGATRAAALLRVLAHEDRLLLLCQLSQGEASVGEIERAVGIRQPMLSQHLAVLRAQALVATRREGRRIHYRVASAEALAVLATLYALYCGPAPGPVGET